MHCRKGSTVVVRRHEHRRTRYTTAVGAPSAEQDAAIRRQSEVSLRSQRIRTRRSQLELALYVSGSALFDGPADSLHDFIQVKRFAD